MTDSAALQPRFVSIIRGATFAYPGALRRLFALSLATAVVTEVLYTASDNDLAAGTEAAVFLGSFVASIAIYVFMTGVMTARQLQAAGRLDGWRPSAILGVTGRMTLWFSLGAVALIVPMLVMAVMWAVVFPVLMLQRTESKQAMQTSRQLVKGHWPTVIAVLLAVSVPYLVGMVPELLGYSVSSPLSLSVRVALSTFANPFWVVVAIAMYGALSRSNEPHH